MTDNIKKVAEFHKASGAPVLTTPQIPDTGRIDLRVSLLEEEVKEFETAAFKKDLVGVIDALTDIQYVLLGTIVEFGLHDLFQEAFDEVHASNMSKFCETYEEAKVSTLHYCHVKRVEAYNRLVGKKFVIRRTSDDKILKGLKFFEPKLKQILRRFMEPK